MQPEYGPQVVDQEEPLMEEVLTDTEAMTGGARGARRVARADTGFAHCCWTADAPVIREVKQDPPPADEDILFGAAEVGPAAAVWHMSS